MLPSQNDLKTCFVLGINFRTTFSASLAAVKGATPPFWAALLLLLLLLVLGRFFGMMVWCAAAFFVLLLCLFEMQRDDGVARPKLGQIAIGFGHIDFHNVHHFFAKRNVLNVRRFKVRAAVSLALVHDFTQQIRHAIPHHDTARHIRVHVQRARGFAHDRTKRRVQVGETPTATHAQVQIVTLIHHPKLRVARTVSEIVPVTPGRHGRDLIFQERLLQIGAQREPGRVVRREHDPPHLGCQFGMHRKDGSGGSAMTNVRVVDHQVFAFPTKLDIRFFAMGIDKFTSEDGFGASLLFHMVEGGFHETHPIHHPIQVFEIVDVDFRGPNGRLFAGGRHVLDPSDVQDVFSFWEQIVHVDARVRQRHGTQSHLPMPPGQMERGR